MKQKGVFRPKYITEEGEAKLKEFISKNPGRYARQLFLREHPECVRESKIYWIRYSCRGCPHHPRGGKHRESTHTESITEAKRTLHSRQGASADGKPIFSKAERVTINELLGLVVADYGNNGLKTLPDVEMRIKLHVLPFFAGRTAQSIRTADIETYKTKRLNERIRPSSRKKTQQDQPAKQPMRMTAPSTINRELSIIQRAFSLGLEQDLIMNQTCRIKKFREDNARQGFVTEEQFETLCKFLPADVAAPVRFAFETGWRMNSEILSRTWAHVDFNSGVIRLESGETKNGEGRTFPLIGKLLKILEEQKAIQQNRIRESGQFCSLLFHHDGKPMSYKDKRGQYKPSTYFRKAWIKACEKARLAGQIPHDFRRVAVSRFERSGITRKVGMQLSGHLTESIFNRYNIVRSQDMEDAREKLEGSARVKKSGAMK